MALVLLIGLMSILLTSTCGLTLTSPSSEYQVVLGHDISLGCHFTLASVDIRDLEIEWTVTRSDGQEEEEHLICYIEDIIHHFTGFEGRIYFTSPDPQDGDASLTINRVKITDEGTYQCTVKKLREVQSRQIKLMVMEEGAVPESDVDLKLRNRSSLVTTFPAIYSLLTSTETSASTQDDFSSQDNAKTTTGTTSVTTTGTTSVTTTGTTSVTITGTTTGTTSVTTTGTTTGTTSVTTTGTTSVTTTGTTSVTTTGSIAVAAPITFIIIISAGIIFRYCRQKRQQTSDEENDSADEARLGHTQSEMGMILDNLENTWNLWEKMGMDLEDITKTIMDMKEEDSTEEVPETQL